MRWLSPPAVGGVVPAGARSRRGPLAGPRVGGEDVVDGRRPASLVEGTSSAVQHRSDCVDDAQVRQIAVRGTPPRTPRWPRCRPPGRLRPRGRPRPPARAAGNASWSTGSNVPVCACRPVDRLGRVRHPVGPAEREAIGSRMSGGDACAMVEPSTNSTIEWIDRLRVHDDLDPVEVDVEQQVRLDHLEALVDQRRGVGRDQRAHVPRRVRQRLLGRDRRRAPRGVAHGTGHRSP